MSRLKASFVALAAVGLVGAAAQLSWAGPGRCCRVYCYAPAPAAATAPATTAQAGGSVQQYRSYSYSPGRRYSYSPGASVYGQRTYSRPALGTSSDYRPGPDYSPRQGINSAAFKVRGL